MKNKIANAVITFDEGHKKRTSNLYPFHNNHDMRLYFLVESMIMDNFSNAYEQIFSSFAEDNKNIDAKDMESLYPLNIDKLRTITNAFSAEVIDWRYERLIKDSLLSQHQIDKIKKELHPDLSIDDFYKCTNSSKELARLYQQKKIRYIEALVNVLDLFEALYKRVNNQESDLNVLKRELKETEFEFESLDKNYLCGNEKQNQTLEILKDFDYNFQSRKKTLQRKIVSLKNKIEIINKVLH